MSEPSFKEMLGWLALTVEKAKRLVKTMGGNWLDESLVIHRAIRAALLGYEKVGKIVGDEIARIESDDRFQAESALVEVNAPLALIQVEMEGRMAVLRPVRAALNPKKEEKPCK